MQLLALKVRWLTLVRSGRCVLTNGGRDWWGAGWDGLMSAFCVYIKGKMFSIYLQAPFYISNSAK